MLLSHNEEARQKSSCSTVEEVVRISQEVGLIVFYLHNEVSKDPKWSSKVQNGLKRPERA